jgi:hypothetical protein
MSTPSILAQEYPGICSAMLMTHMCVVATAAGGPPGELPVLLAVQSGSGCSCTLLAEASVMDTLQQHRLAELKSTGAASSTHKL